MKGEDVGIIVGVAERPTVLLVDDVVNMVVEVTGGYALLRVCLTGGSIVCTTVGVAEGVKIVSMVAAVSEGAGCSVCFVHVWGKVGREVLGGVFLCTFIVLVTWEPY